METALPSPPHEGLPPSPATAPRARRLRRQFAAGWVGVAWGLIASLLAGATVTLLISWGCVLWSPIPPRGAEHGGGTWPCEVPAVWPRTYDRLSTCENAGWSVEDYSVEPQGKYVLLVQRWGWPLKTMELRSWGWSGAALQALRPPGPIGNKPNIIKIPDGPRDIFIRLPKWCGHPPQRSGAPFLLPLRPVLPAFAASTAVYTAAVWLATAGVSRLRRSRRRKRGACPWCGYDLRGLPAMAEGGPVCPECGGL